MTTSELLESGLADIYRTVFADASNTVLVVDPLQNDIEQVLTVVSKLDDPPTIRILARHRPLNDAMDDFKVASIAADLIEAGTLTLRETEELFQNRLLLTDSAVVAIVSANGRVAGLTSSDATFTENANAKYRNIWETGNRFKLRTPPISMVRETLEELFSSEVREDFDAMLGSLDTARGDGDGLDKVTICLLVAAKNELLLYDISTWGEDIGLASKATFSRMKTSLEEIGLIDTEKVPIDIGRPRLRLLLGDERLRAADADDLSDVAQSLLSVNA